MNAKPNVSQPNVEPLSLDSRNWLEQHWEDSGLPQSICRRLFKIDAGVSGARHLAEILSADNTNRGLVEGMEEEYTPLSEYHVEGLMSAMGTLLASASADLAELHDFAEKYRVTFEERHE